MAESASLWWTEVGRERQRYLALACQGVDKRTGHIYFIQDCGGDKAIEIGYMSLAKARRELGRENIFVAPSHAICPECMARYVEEGRKAARRARRRK